MMRQDAPDDRVALVSSR